MAKEKDERVAKLQGTIKELKGSAASLKDLKASLAAKDADIAGLRKQLGAAQRVEDELRKQQASAASTVKAEKTDAIAKLKGSIEQNHSLELKRQHEEHDQVLAARNRELANMTAQLKQALEKCQQAQSSLSSERDKMRQALLTARTMAEVSMDYSTEEDRLLAKVEGRVEECSIQEVHWLMTRTFRSWLAQSYSECDEVCDALEAEQLRLKRIYHSKEQELGKMRAHAAHLKSRIFWVYQVCDHPDAISDGGIGSAHLSPPHSSCTYEAMTTQIIRLKEPDLLMSTVFVPRASSDKRSHGHVAAPGLSHDRFQPSLLPWPTPSPSRSRRSSC